MAQAAFRSALRKGLGQDGIVLPGRFNREGTTCQRRGAVANTPGCVTFPPILWMIPLSTVMAEGVRGWSVLRPVTELMRHVIHGRRLSLARTAQQR